MSSEQGCLLIRADSGRRAGIGHVMRCLALAQAWQDEGGQVVMIINDRQPQLVARLENEGIGIIQIQHKDEESGDVDCVVETAKEKHAHWVVVDGYRFDHRYQCTIKNSGLNLLCIDDYGHAAHYSADLVVNQNISADQALYPKHDPGTHFLLGTHFVLLRREFLEWRGWQRPVNPKVNKLLVTLGGSDPSDITGILTRTLTDARFNNHKVRIIAGPANPNSDALGKEVSERRNFQLVFNETDMPGTMAWADIAISVGGSTSWELAFMALPSLLLILASNQRPITEKLDAVGAAINLGEPGPDLPEMLIESLGTLESDPERRAFMGKQGRTLVDGGGAARVVTHMGKRQFTFTKAAASDERMLWELANETTARENSFDTALIPWDVHVQWFKSKLKDPNCIHYVGSNGNGETLGVVRFELLDDDATLSINLKKEMRGKGYGSVMTREAAERLFRTTRVNSISAYVKEANQASMRMFLKAGFTSMGPVNIKNQPAWLYILDRKHS